jgi:hypothetical protein
LICFLNLLFKNPFGEVKALANFLGKSYTDDDLVELIRFTSFKEMKSRDSKYTESKLWLKENAKFLRSGKIGDWRNSFTDDMIEQLDECLAKNLKANVEFCYEPFEQKALGV